jgi:beta-lactam-binding protein with PASTA domain
MKSILVLVLVVAALAAVAVGAPASAPQTVAMPDVRGLPLDAALERLADAPVCPTRINRDAATSDVIHVLAQEPPPGAEIEPLSPVALRVTTPKASLVEAVAAPGCSPPPLTASPLPFG